MIGARHRQWTLVGGDHDVFEAHTPAIGQVDTRLDAEGMTRCNGERVALHHVGIFVFLHTDAMSGPVDEILAEAGIDDDPSGRSIHVLTRDAHDPGCNASRVRGVQHRVGASDVVWHRPEMHTAGDVAAVTIHRAADVDEHEVAGANDAITGMVMR